MTMQECYKVRAVLQWGARRWWPYGKTSWEHEESYATEAAAAEAAAVFNRWEGPWRHEVFHVVTVAASAPDPLRRVVEL